MSSVNPGKTVIPDTTDLEQVMKRLRVLDTGVMGYITANSQYILLHEGARVRVQMVSGTGPLSKGEWQVGDKAEEIAVDAKSIYQLFIYRGGRLVLCTSRIQFRLQFDGGDLTVVRYKK